MYKRQALDVMPAIVRDKPAYEEQYLQFIREMIQKGVVASDPRDIDNADIINQIFLARMTKDGIELRDVKPISAAPTLAEIWERVKAANLRNLQNPNTVRNYDTAFKHLQLIHHVPIDIITLKDIQPIFDQQMRNHASYAKMNLMKVVLNHCFRHAIDVYKRQGQDGLLKLHASLKILAGHNMAPLSSGSGHCVPSCALQLSSPSSDFFRLSIHLPRSSP